MRALKFLLAAVLAVLAVTVGFVAVAVLAAAILAYFLGRFVLRSFRKAPLPPAASAPARRAAPAGHGEVIEVTATEVPSERVH